MSRNEITGWRDENISRRHRKYGSNCPAVDLDFVLIEYSNAKPAALIEYKSGTIHSVDMNSPSHLTLRALADAALIPFAVACYDSETWTYNIHPGNQLACEFFPYDEMLTERQYVETLYKIRGIEPEESILKNLCDSF